MDFKQIYRKIIQVFIPLSLGLALLWYMYRNQDLNEMMLVIKEGVRYDIILFSLIFGLFGNVVRALRWGMLIDSLGKRVNRKNIIFAVLGNYAINMALPRVGEIWRCGVTSKYEKVPFTKLLGTLFVDRIMDVITVGLLTLCLCVFNIRFFRNFFSENPPLFVEKIYMLMTSIWTYVGIVILIALMWIVFFKLKHLIIVQKIIDIMKNVWEGVRSLWRIEHKIRFIIQSILIWGGYFLFFYITFFAFDFTEDLGIRIALIAFAMSSIGVAVPIQGGIGVWHFMVITTLVAFGVNEADAGVFAFIVFAIQTMWVIIAGLVGIVALPIVNKQNVSLTEN